MTFKEFKNIINVAEADDNARVYIEQPLINDVFLQTEVISTRREVNDIGSYFIIVGKTGDQV